METLDATYTETDKAIGEAVADIIDSLTGWDEAGVTHSNIDDRTGEVERIEHNSRSGFIPYTNGGWNGVAYVSFNRGRWGSWKCMEGYYARDEKEMACEFFRRERAGEEHDDELTAFYNVIEAERLKAEEPLLPGMPHVYADSMPAHKWREGWEMEGDDCTFFLVVRAIYFLPGNSRCETGEPEVYFFAGVNLDFDYGRDSIAWAGGDQYAKPTFDLTVPLDQVTPEKLTEIKASVLDLFRNA